MTDWSKYKIQDDTPKKSKWDQYKIEEPSKKNEDSESTSTLPVSESKEQLSTPVVSHSGFRTVREKGTAQTPGIAIEKTPTDVIVFDEQKEIEEFEKQRELSQLNVKEKYATIKPQLDELKQTLTKQKDETDAAFNYARTTLEELKRAGQLDNTAPDVAELSNSYSTLYKQTQDNDKALRNIKDAELFVEDLEKVISGKNKKFSEGASQTFLKKIAFDGIAEIKRNYNLKNISDKLANNEDITEDERLAISTYGLLNEAQANFPSGIGYDVGRGLVEMVPYLASFAASGGASKVIQQGLMQAMKSTGAKTTQEMLKKGLAYVSGQAVRPAFFTSLYSQGLEKQIGQVDTDQEGKPTIAEGTKEKPIKAFTKAYANTLSEVMTEQLGEVAAPLVNRIVGKEVKQVLNPSIITKVKDAVAFNGFVLEMGEEFANKAANVAIEGQPATEIFNPREILTTAMTVGVMSGGFMVANAPYKRSVSAKVQETGASLDTKTRKQVDNIVESSKPVEDKAKELSYIVDEKVKSNAPESEVSNVVQYATASNAERTAKNVEDVVPVIEKNKNNMSGEQAQQTREKVESELKDKYGNERGAELLSMFDFFTEKYVYTPEEFSALNKGKKKPSEPLEPKSDITPPLEVENAPTIETIPVDAKNIIDQHKDFIEIRTTPQETGSQEEMVTGEEGRIRVRDDEGSRVEAQEGVAEEVPKETVGSLLEKEEQNKKKKSGFLPFVLPLSIFQSPRAKRKAVDIKQVLREQFLPSRGMPQSIYKEFVKYKGKVNARKFDIQRSFKQMTKDLYDAYGEKITPEQKEAINTALENLGPSQASRNIAFNTISKSVPVEARGIVERMRNDIDAYTEDLKKLDMIGVGLEGKMDANTGYYVTRTYKKHTDRDWTWEKIPIKIKEDAANKLMEVFGIEADEALGMAKEMLETPDLTDYVIRKGNSLADIDKRSLNKRSVFLTDNPEIRKLLGENRDPLYNYAMSMTRMAEMIEKGKMLENIRDIGLAEGILSEKPSFEKNHVAQIKYNKGLFAGKPGTKQLADYYTTPEIAKSINSFMSPSGPASKLTRAYMQLITSSKIAKTALSWKGLTRNFQSNPVNALANGNWNIPQTTQYIYNALKNKDTRTGFIRELYEENIIGDSANAAELIRNVEDLSNKISVIERSDESLGEKGKRVVIDNALKLYGLADDVWKAYRYVSEKLKYEYVFEKKGYNPQEATELAKKEASRILHKTSTYYSELPPIMQNMRKLPFANTFISFPYLTTVNMLGTVETAVKEMRDPATFFIGAQRMAGSILAISALTALSEFRNKEEGQDEKDVEAWRRFLPDFWRNDIITITKDHGNGQAEYNNSSYLDYYNAITTPVLMLRRKVIANGEITDDDLIDIAEEFSKNFLSWDIIFDRLTQVKANEDELGRAVYNKQDTGRNKFNAILAHIWEGVEPGTITDARRIYKSYREGGEWQKQMIGTLTGRQTRSIDPLKSLDFYMLPKYKDQFNNARSIYKNQLKQYNRLKEKTEADTQRLQDTKERAEKILNKILEETVTDYNAAIRVGVDKQELDKVVRGEKFDKDVTVSILFGLQLGLNDEGGIVVKQNQNQP